jgi:transglutaminase/protease-like cytokinesis protein 3
MRRNFFVILAILFTNILYAQKTAVNEFAAIDKKVLSIPDTATLTTSAIADYINSNFTTSADKVRAAFFWVASNLQYDLDNMYAINYYETQSDKINKALATRKGICENYAATFNDICLKCNIKSYIIEGYTKQNGFRDYIPHAWCAAYIDTTWYLFDPTWGSGYVNNGKFYKRINNTYFKAKPSFFIIDHMPFDYLWQFLNYPVATGDFYVGRILPNTSKPYFDFADSISVYEQSTHIDQLTAEARRIEANGIKNSMIFDRLQHIKMDIENVKIEEQNAKQNALANLYHTALIDYNASVKYFNKFIDYRNHQFQPEKNDGEIKAMLDSVKAGINRSEKNINEINGASADNQKIVDQLKDAIADIKTHEKEQREWLNIYFSKSKSKRKTMFYDKKITWFGVPLNK